MTEMAKLVNQYGVGAIAVVIIFVLFVLIVKKLINSWSDERKANANLILQSNERSLKLQEEHNATQVRALEKVAESNNNVAEALALIRDMFVDRTNAITNKQDLMMNAVTTHCTDVHRMEAMMAKLQESILKTEERTKQCAQSREIVGK